MKVFILVLCLCVSSLSAYERVDLLEPGLDMMFRISDGAALLKALDNSPVGKFWNSPQMKAFLNNQSLEETLIKDIFTDSVPANRTQEAVAVNRKIVSSFKGEIAAGLMFGENDNMFFSVLTEMNEADYKIVRELFKQENKLSGTKAVYQQHSFQGVDLFQTITKAKEGEKSEWMAFYGNTGIFGSKRPWVEQCIVRLKKELPQKKTGPPSFHVWFPDDFFNRIMEINRQRKSPIEEAAAGPLPDSGAVMKALGFAGIGKISFKWTINPSFTEAELSLRNKGAKKGIWTLLSGVPISSRHSLGYVPKNVLTYQVMGVDFFAFWQQLPTMMNEVNPAAAAQFNMGIQYISQLLQVDMGRDFFANLDTVFTYYSKPEGNDSQSLYIWQLRNARAMGKTLEKIFGENTYLRTMLKENFEALTLQDYKVYVIKVPQSQGEDLSGPISRRRGSLNGLWFPGDYGHPQEKRGRRHRRGDGEVVFSSIGLAVIDGDFVFGPLNLLRSYINGSRSNEAAREFYKSPIFTRMIRRVPDDAAGYGLLDVSLLIEQGMNFLKTAARLSPPPQAPPGGQVPGSKHTPSPFDDFFDNLKFDKLPAPDFVRSFFGPAVNYYRFDGKELLVRWEFHNPINK